MSGNRTCARSPAYAGPAFCNSPPAASFLPPIFKFSKRSSNISVVSSDSERSSESSTKSKSVSFTSDTKSYDGKKAISANKEQDRSIDMKSNTKFTASAQESVALEKVAKRIKKDNEAQAKRARAQHQVSQMPELPHCQQAIVYPIEQKSTRVIRYTIQQMIDIRDRISTIPANAQHQTEETNQQIQDMRQHAAENQANWQGTIHLLQLALKRLEQNLAQQQEILQQRLDQIRKELRQGEGNLADDEMGLTSSSDEDSFANADDEVTLIDVEIDRYESHHRETILPSNLSLAAKKAENVSEDSNETAVEVGIEAEEEEEAEDRVDVEDFEDVNYPPAENMVEEQEDEGYFSMDE